MTKLTDKTDNLVISALSRGSFSGKKQLTPREISASIKAESLRNSKWILDDWKNCDCYIASPDKILKSVKRLSDAGKLLKTPIDDKRVKFAYELAS
jgi:hypothetical protein